MLTSVGIDVRTDVYNAIWKENDTIPVGVINNGGYSGLYNLWVCVLSTNVHILAQRDGPQSDYCVFRIIDGMCVEIDHNGVAIGAPMIIMVGSAYLDFAINLTPTGDVFTAAISMAHKRTYFWHRFEIADNGVWRLVRTQVRPSRVDYRMRALYDTITGEEYYSTGWNGPRMTLYDAHGRTLFVVDIATHGFRTWYAHSVYNGTFTLSAYRADDNDLKLILMQFNAVGERIGNAIATNCVGTRMSATQIDANTIEYLDYDEDVPIRVTYDIHAGMEISRVYLHGGWH